jgi:hypothetical protein
MTVDGFRREYDECHAALVAVLVGRGDRVAVEAQPAVLRNDRVAAKVRSANADCCCVS